jgi:NADPH-dependent ferric siderophore reductase
VRWLTPGLIRVTFADPALCDYPGTGVGDEYARLTFPSEGEGHPSVAPYTIRRHDPFAGEIDIDFVAHGRGVATEWARRAAPGDYLRLARPRALFEPPTGVTRMVFVSDATGLPALGRLLEQLDETVQALCIVEIADESHVLELSSPATVQLQWIVGRGNGVAASAITEALRATDLRDDVYVWVAGESKELREARRHLRHERGLPPERYKVIGYWTHKREQWHERYNALDDSTLAILNSTWDETPDEELRRDRYEAQLTRLGL